jgi:DNA-binding MarR family transcriptional regulator
MKQISYHKVEKHRLAGVLVYTAMRMERMADNSIFKPLNLTTASFRILMVLQEAGSQSPSDIIDALGGTKSNVTQRLNYLTKKKLVILTHGAEKDKRRSSAVISDLGSKLVKDAYKLFKEKDLHIEKYFTTK